MKKYGTLPATLLVLAGLMPVINGLHAEAAPSPPNTPTLTRLYFVVPPDRMDEFAAAYAKKVAPILAAHRLVEAAERGRATSDSIFSRLFAFAAPATAVRATQALAADSAWIALLLDLGTTYGAQPYREDGHIEAHFGLYEAPGGPGKGTPAGPGKKVPVGPITPRWEDFDVTHGLSGPQPWTMYQDRDGYLWFGTLSNGLSRFDGQTWTPITTAEGLPGIFVTSILEDRDGRLWCGFGDWEDDGVGVGRYDGRSWTTFTKDDGLAHNRVFALLQDRDGDLWFGTLGGGASRYDGQTFTTFTADNSGLAHNHVMALLEDRDGDLWFGTWGGGVSRYDGRNWTTFTSDDGLGDNRVKSIFQDRDGQLWFGTWGGVSRYDGQTFTTFTTDDSLAHNRVVAILQDPKGRFVFGTRGGVSRYDGLTFTTLNTRGARSLAWDREGHLWAGWSAGGASRYDDGTFTTFTGAEGRPEQAGWDMVQDSNGLWMTSVAGLVHYDGQTWTTFTTEDGLPHNTIQGIERDRQGRLWLGTPAGLVRYDGETFTTFTTEDGLPHDNVGAWSSLLVDRKGRVWFSSGGEDGAQGLTRYDGHTFTTFTAADGLGSNQLNNFFEDRDGNLWFGNGCQGVVRYDGEGFTTFTTNDGLPNPCVFGCTQDRDGHMWFVTHGGISRYDGEGFTNFTTRDGLASNDLHSGGLDSKGHLWFGTDGGGVSRYDGQVFQNLTARDGLPDNIVAYLKLEDREGNYWIITSKGLTRYRPPPPTQPPVFVDAVVADRRYAQPVEVSVPATAGLVAFEFHGMSFKTHRQSMVYRYRLQGHQDEWQLTRQRRIEYAGLAEGSYTFEVIAVDRDLVYSAAPARVALTVRPPLPGYQYKKP